MSLPESLAILLTTFINAIRSENLEWRRRKADEIAALRKKQKLLDLELEHELATREIELREEIRRIEMRETSVTHDYKDFLNEIDELKRRIVSTFTNMPKPMALLIHHHAKQMLNEMWQAQDLHERLAIEQKLLNFMTVIYDDTQRLTQADDLDRLPTKTIEFMNSGLH
jgi:hypothetical protein